MCWFDDSGVFFCYKLKQFEKKYKYLAPFITNFFSSWKELYSVIHRKTNLSEERIQNDIQYLIDNKYLYISYYDEYESLPSKPKPTFFQKIKK